MGLVTRSDLNGLVSAMQLTTMEHVNSLELVHPQDITDNKFEVIEGDILANLPHHPNCTIIASPMHTAIMKNTNFVISGPVFGIGNDSSRLTKPF